MGIYFEQTTHSGHRAVMPVQPESLRQRSSNLCDPEAQSVMSADNCHNQLLRNSTDILLRKNSLILQEASEMTSIESNTLKAAPMAPTERASQFTSSFSSLHQSPQSRSSLHCLRPIHSLPNRKRHSNYVPLVLALIYCLVQSVLSSPITMENSEVTTTSDTTASPPTTLAHISSTQHSRPSHLPPPQHKMVHENLNPIELNLLDHLMKNQWSLHRGYHHKKSRHVNGEHIFDPTSEEITMKLANSGRTSATSQKRDIHEPIEGMYISPRHQPSHTTGSNHNGQYEAKHPAAHHRMPQQRMHPQQ